MSLNDIKLQPQQIAGLYPDILIETKLMTEFIPEHPVIAESRQAEVPVAEPMTVRAENKIEEPKPVVTKVTEVEEEVTREATKVTGVIPEVIETIPEVVAEEQKFDFKGNNRKKILVLVANDRVPYLPDSELKFLLSVLKACMLTIEDVAILNLKTNPADHVKLHSFFNYKIALLFGTEPQNIDLPMNFPPFQVQNFNNSIYLHAPNLTEIEKAKELKMKLWTCLKNMFAL